MYSPRLSFRPFPIARRAARPAPFRQAQDDQPTVAQLGAIEGLSGDYKGASISLKPGEKIIIGRDPQSCNIVISSEKKDGKSSITLRWDKVPGAGKYNLKLFPKGQVFLRLKLEKTL